MVKQEFTHSFVIWDLIIDDILPVIGNRIEGKEIALIYLCSK